MELEIIYNLPYMTVMLNMKDSDVFPTSIQISPKNIYH